MPPLISVIIPLYNHEKFIYRAALSVLDQTYENLELIIIDDGSSDNSVAAVSRISDNRLKLFTQDNCGAHATINRGIASAKGEYITVLNSDDLYYPARLHTFVSAMAEDNEIDALFSQVEAIHEDDSHYFYFTNTPKHHIPLNRDHPDQRRGADLLGINIVTTTSNLFCKKEVFDEIGLFKNYRYCHDLDFFLRLFQQKHVRCINKPLLRYRVHAANTLNDDSGMVHFEKAIILADFLQKQPPDQLVPGLQPAQASAHLFSIQHDPHIDRILHILSLYSRERESWQKLRDSLMQDPSHPLRRTCLNYLQDSLDLEEKQNKTDGRNKHLTETLERLKKDISLYEQSVSLKIGRCCSWPVRKISWPVRKIRNILKTFFS